MNGRRGAWLVLALVAGPVVAGPQEGRLEVTVLDDVTGDPVILAEVVLTRTGFWAGTMTDDNGLAVFGPIPVANYTLTTQPMIYPYYWDRRSVAVGASPPATEVTVRLERVVPTPYVEIMAPEGTVGNTVPVTYRFYQNDFHWLTRVRIEAVPSGHAGPTQEISDLTAGQLGDSTQVGTTTLADGVTPVEIRERTVEWDTTGLYNDAYTLRVLVWYEDPWDPGGDDIDGTDERGVAVRNLCFGDVTTSAGNPDYFLFDAKEGSGFEHPTITFEFKDEGQTSNAQGPYHYDWTAMVLTTQAEDPETACDAYVTGTTTSPGTVTVYLNDTAQQVAAGQQQIGELTAEHWGTLTFDLCVEERETGDYYYYRMPYYLTIPETVPYTQLPGHDAGLASTPAGVPSVFADYYLDDNEDASWFQIDSWSPDLTLMGTANPGTQAHHHYQDEVVSTVTVFKAKPYIIVFRGVDSHGDDGDPRSHRERENKRMLPVNRKPGPSIQSVTLSTYAGNTQIDSNPGNGQAGSAIGQRIFPDFQTEEDENGADRRKVTVTVQLSLDPDQAKAGWPVTLKAFDVDDPSASASPIDDEQAWPADNADNRDQTYPKGQFEGGGEQIERTTDADGKVTVVFLTGMQPGDNYRIAAGMGTLAQMPPLKARANDVEEGTQRSRVWRQVDEEWTPLPEVGPSDWLESGALTVWRKLYLELDSMGPPYYEGESTKVTTEPRTLEDSERFPLVRAKAPWDPDCFVDFPDENGRWHLNPNTPGGALFTPQSNHYFGVTVAERQEPPFWPAGAQTGSTYRIDYQGFTDDDPASEPADIPDVGAACFSQVLTSCYLQPVLLSVPYSRGDYCWHHTMGQDPDAYLAEVTACQYVCARSWRKSQVEPQWWSVYVLMAYDCANFDHDNDDDAEVAALGVTKRPDQGYLPVTLVYSEVIRDLAAEKGWSSAVVQDLVNIVTMHEVCHQLGAQHLIELDGEARPSSLMWAPTDASDEALLRLVPLRLAPIGCHDVRQNLMPIMPHA